jgi:hypothetical protein
MSWDNDRDHHDDRGAEATCTDCGRAFVNGPDATGALCDDCCDLRDAHASALELRMVKADLVARSNSHMHSDAVIDVALVPIRQPAGYLPWLDSLRANAHWGSDALARAWYVSPTLYIQHLITVAPDLWTTLQAIAARQAA